MPAPLGAGILFRMTSKAGEPNEPTARALVAQALRLPESERVRVAAELLESVEGPPDDVSDDEWLAEVNRRADSVRRGYAKVRRDVDKLSSDVTDYVRENPGKSLLMAAGVGFVIGLLLRRGRED